MRTVNFEQLHENRIEKGERMAEESRRILVALALRDHPRLFDVEPAPVIPLPSRVWMDGAA